MDIDEFEEWMGRPHRNCIKEIRDSRINQKDPSDSEFEKLMADREERVLKHKMAEKILNPKEDLSAQDRQNIYYFLTGIVQPLSRSGRKSTKERDASIARRFIAAESKSGRSKCKVEIVKEYKWSTNDNAFYAALNKGLSLLKEQLETSLSLYAYMQKNEFGISPTRLESLNEDARIHHLIIEYEKEKSHLKKS